MQIITNLFNFQDSIIRIITINHNYWFVAKDIASALEYSDTYSMTRSHIDDEDMQKISPARFTELSNLFAEHKEFGHKDITLINESGLYSAILGSKKPVAKIFKRWITREVLPSIRKTGNYSISQNFQLPEIGNSTQKMIELKNDFLETSNLIEILESKKLTTLYRLDKFYRKFHNFSPLEHFEIDLNSQFFLPTELGKMINKSPVEINLMLEHKGFQVQENGVWKITSSGNEFGMLIIGKYNQIKWKLKAVL